MEENSHLYPEVLRVSVLKPCDRMLGQNTEWHPASVPSQECQVLSSRRRWWPLALGSDPEMYTTLEINFWRVPLRGTVAPSFPKLPGGSLCPTPNLFCKKTKGKKRLRYENRMWGQLGEQAASSGGQAATSTTGYCL